MNGSPFKDHFSGHAPEYSAYRPVYPDALFVRLAELAPDRRLAWDAAAGNGQASVALAQQFDRVVATDASRAQIAHAERDARVTYALCRAEDACFASGSVSLVTVAQALHWLDPDSFFDAARHAAVPGGVIAAWCYGTPSVDTSVDAVIARFHGRVLSGYWPPGRRHVDAMYTTLPFPFERLSVPDFEMHASWTLRQFTDYIATWSAVRRFLADRDTDSLGVISAELEQAWGDPFAERAVTWPLSVLAGRI